MTAKSFITDRLDTDALKQATHDTLYSYVFILYRITKQYTNFFQGKTINLKKIKISVTGHCACFLSLAKFKKYIGLHDEDIILAFGAEHVRI